LQVAEAADRVQRVAAMERFILERMTGCEADPIVLAAARAIRTSLGTLRIAHLAHSLGISQERLEKRFRRAVGASPKQFASMLRLRHAVKRWQPGESLTRLSAEAGYYDQPHFTREFRSVVGRTPRAFFGRVEYC
jgi:AraC-like DNA-binding protein